MTKGWSRLVLDVEIASSQDLQKVTSILEQILRTSTETHPAIILEPPTIVGVEKLGESSVTVRALVKTQPGQQWTSGRELRAQVKEGFQAEGIEIPFPQCTLWVRQEENQTQVSLHR